MRINILQKTKNQMVTRITTLENVAEKIRDGKFSAAVANLRIWLPILKRKEYAEHDIDSFDVIKGLPKVCFASRLDLPQKDDGGEWYNGLILIETEHLDDPDTAIIIRKEAAKMPQTLMTFVGASGTSVKIVCRAELIPDLAGDERKLPMTVKDISTFHLNAFRMAYRAYSAQLNVRFADRKPQMDSFCYISADSGVVLRTDAIPFYVDLNESADITRVPMLNRNEMECLPGRNECQSRRLVFQFCLGEAMDHSMNVPDEERTVEILNKLAIYCRESDLPVEMAVRNTLYNSDLSRDELLVRKIFDNAYGHKRDKACLFRHLPESLLVMLKTKRFMESRYELRKNILTGVPQYRKRDGYNYDFQDITKEVRNSMTMQALMEGLNSWDKDMDRFIDSNEIKPYDPVNDYLDGLPKWDGKDRVKELAKRVPNDDQDWTKNFHVWMRAMVANWMGKDGKHGNAYAPLLIGGQGCGKTSFCNILMPRELRDYYIDRVDFKNEKEVNMGMSSFALINIDEFDSMKKSQQATLKAFLSKSDIKMRAPYGKVFENRRRYASFIGTTNVFKPLTDPTGSRRFLCIMVKGAIDFKTPVNYEQLYAQLKTEVESGEMIFFNDIETQKIMETNRAFECIDGVDQIVSSLFCKPLDDEESDLMNVKDIIGTIKRFYPNFQTTASSVQRVGNWLSRSGFIPKHTRNGNAYMVKKLVE